MENNLLGTLWSFFLPDFYAILRKNEEKKKTHSEVTQYNHVQKWHPSVPRSGILLCPEVASYCAWKWHTVHRMWNKHVFPLFPLTDEQQNPSLIMSENVANVLWRGLRHKPYLLTR